MCENSATANMMDNYGDSNCLVYPNGEVLWVPPAELKVFCDLDLTLWPFDTQTCNMTLGSWTYDGSKIDLVLYEQTPDVSCVYIFLVIFNSIISILKKKKITCIEKRGGSKARGHMNPPDTKSLVIREGVHIIYLSV